MIEMALIAPGIKVKKIVKTEKQATIFERDMPAKHKLLFTKIPYVIVRKYLDAID